ncbi:SDR family NAD(P)-dependent oxidoreductase [Chloroflexota bacterium]
MRLRGKVAIVTGAAGGIGSAISLALAKEGANVIVNDIDIDGITRVANDIKSLGRKVIPIKADVTKSQEVNQMAKQAIDELGGVDILVNCAGGSGPLKSLGPFIDMTEETWDSVVNLNLKGVRNCCAAVIKHMVEKRSGKIINIASDSGVVGEVGKIHYAAAKAAVIMFTNTLAKEVGQYGLYVNSIAPGSIKHARRPKEGPKYEDKLRRTPLGRFGVPDEIANVVVFLASDESSYIDGENICVTGGRI